MTFGPDFPPVRRLDFPGGSDSRVLVIAGVHGSERAGVEVVDRLVWDLATIPMEMQFSITVIPVLFLANYDYATRTFRASQGGRNPQEMEDSRNGRFTLVSGRRYSDPNRQFPKQGECLKARLGSGQYKDSAEREIEAENVFLINLIEDLRPVRIVSVHSIAREKAKVTTKDYGKRNLPGVFVDPVTTLDVKKTRENPLAMPPKGKDDDLALEAAYLIQRRQEEAKRNGLVKDRYHDLLDDWVAGNWLNTNRPLSRYANAVPTEPGISLGEWAPRKAVCAAGERNGIPVFTIEIRRYYQSSDYLPLYKSGRTSGENNARVKAEWQERDLELQAHAEAIRTILLGK